MASALLRLSAWLEMNDFMWGCIFTGVGKIALTQINKDTKMKSLKIFASLAFTLAALTGCTTATVLDAGSSEGQKAASFAPAEGRAVVYLYRNRAADDFQGFQLNVNFDGDAVTMFPACFKRIELKPGQIELEATHPDVFGFEQEVVVSLKAGDVKVYEFRPISKFGLPGESKLIEVSPETGKAVVADQRLCMLETKYF
jgi:hypothetical protein